MKCIGNSNLTMTFITEGSLGMIYKAMSNHDWPAGLAYQVVVLLFKKFSPDDRISRVELRTMLNAVTMKVNEADPSVLFEPVSAIQNGYDTVNHKIDKEELIAVVMGTSQK
jgi:hypothetical protein